MESHRSAPSDRLRDLYERRAQLEYPAPAASPDPALDRKFERVCELVAEQLPCRRYLDAGCGDGRYLAALARLPARPEHVAAAVAELGYADCTATAFRPAYLPPGASRLSLAEPAWLRVGEATLLELPATHSLGMAARAALGPLPRYVHVYFHDSDLLDRRRRLALEAALAVLGRRRGPARLDGVAAETELDFSAAAV